MIEPPAGVSRVTGESLVRMVVFALLLILIVSLGIMSASIHRVKSLIRENRPSGLPLAELRSIAGCVIYEQRLLVGTDQRRMA